MILLTDSAALCYNCGERRKTVRKNKTEVNRMLSSRPPMGFNTWNTFGENISDAMIRETADAMVEKGLLDAGYRYLVIDDCWSKRQRDPESGKIVPEPVKFPNGMKAVSDYVHGRGLLFGMYSCAGVRTCADYPGSFDHEFLDAETFAEYGADFLKYDFCNRPAAADGPLLYKRISAALRASGREILLSACNWGCDEVEKWIRSVGAHMYRSTGDINDSFASFRDIFMSQRDKFAYSAPGCFNDIDMLTVGMYANGNVGAGGCTDVEYKTQFAIWCMFACPLMLGCDIRKLDGFCLDLVKNKYLIRINQDEEARTPMCVRSEHSGLANVFVRVLSDNEYAVMFLNLTDHDRRCWFTLEDMGITASSGLCLKATAVFTGEDAGTHAEFWQMNLPAHDCAVYLCRAVKA